MVPDHCGFEEVPVPRMGVTPPAQPDRTARDRGGVESGVAYYRRPQEDDTPQGQGGGRGTTAHLRTVVGGEDPYRPSSWSP